MAAVIEGALVVEVKRKVSVKVQIPLQDECAASLSYDYRENVAAIPNGI